VPEGNVKLASFFSGIPSAASNSASRLRWTPRRSSRSSATSTRAACWRGTGPTRCASTTCARSRRVAGWTRTRCRARTCGAAASRVRTSALQAAWRAFVVRDPDFSSPGCVPFASFDPTTSSWRTCQRSLLEPTSDPFSGSWPRRGTMRSGTCWERGRSALRIGGTAGSSSGGGPNSEGLWPTPTQGDHATRFAQGGMPLGMAARMWPTPTARDHKDGTAQSCANVPVNGLLGRAIHRMWGTPNAHPRTFTPRQQTRPSDEACQLANQVGGALNPTWVSLLMGFPADWTEVK